MHTRTVPYLFLSAVLLLAPLFVSGQVASPAPTSTTTASQAAPAMSPEMASDIAAYGEMLGQLRAAAQQTASDLGKLRVDKWKADSSTKQDSQSNITSLQRNLTAAMPEIIQKAQAAPQDLGPSFNLYRNLNVVYDVLASTAENAGAFGPKEQYEPLANDIRTLDQVRRGMADRLNWLAGVKDSQIKQLSQQLTVAQQQAKAAAVTPAASAEPPAKKKTVKKKKTPAPSTQE